MSEPGQLQKLVDAGHVDPSIFELRPDYRAVLLAVDGLIPGASNEASEALLQKAEASARSALQEQKVESLPHVAAWRAAYQGFGAKPNRTRNSLEALLRRAVTGLPRVNRLTDIYNAISVLHQIPLGGEDLSKYSGPPRLIRATGEEPFDTASNGETVIEHPEPGEVIWCDDEGVTCRRWNWRQGRRTQLQDETTTALFILDALDPVTTDALQAATEDLATHLSSLGPDITITDHLITKTTLT
ncbi:phenylalanine--tRNA ligase beta subunit-related protein [Arthrobacter sp. fls2-241-R2A-200]|uniref:B3/B4 domain-containing protein n=1 Tax=unclassified Arthrobacter TaxID=235627 RepID=UPI00254E1369|nr:phenylalanine--tRNA ligase beta subunit-related protein [Arthrobacter sp. fls2-241-R2A-200]